MRRLLIITISTLVLGALALYVLSRSGDNLAQAAWWNDDWSYRNAVPITSHTAAENNVYISVTVDSTSNFQADCGDMRWTNQAGEQLPYYIVSGCGGASTVVHVFLATFPAGAQTVYYYYGNPTAINGFSSADFSSEAASYAIGTIASQEKAPAPIAYWKMDEATGNTAYDSSSNGNNGALGESSFNPAWGYRVSVTVQNGEVDADLTNFPVYVDLSDLPAGFHTNVKSDGCDIRVTKADGLTEVPFELVFYSSSTDTGELHFLADSLADASDTTFYIYYGNSGASCYAEDATYGAQNVWTNLYKAVYHLQQDPSGTVLDSTANNYDMTQAGGMTSSNLVTGVLPGYAMDFDGTDDKLSDADQTWPDSDNTVTVQFWNYVASANVKNSNSFVYNFAGGGNQRLASHSPYGDNVIYWDFGTCCSTSRISGSYAAYDDKWTFIHLTSNGTTQKRIFLDGVKTYYNDSSADAPNVDGNNFQMGGANVYEDGQIDEFRISTINRADTWISTEYNNQFDPGTFYAVGSQEDNGSNRPTWQPAQLCQAVTCLLFDGSNDLVTVTNANSIDLDQALAQGFSVVTWINPKSDGESDAGQIFQKGTNTYLRTSGQSGNRVNLQASLDLATSDATVTISSAVALNEWTQVAMVYDNDADDEIDIYVNGLHVGTSTNGSGSPATDANNLLIGGSSGANFDGFIDNFKIYNFPISSSEIKVNFNSGNAGQEVLGANVLGGSQSQRDKALANGLVGYWNLNESSGNAADYSGNDLTLTNNGTTTYVNGKFNRGSEHIPASSQYFSTATTISGVKSVSFWTNPDSTTNYFVSLTSGAYITAASGVLSATGITSPKIYVNGEPSTTIVADRWQLVTVTSEVGIDANQFYVGRQGANYYDGTLDEVRTYNRALTPLEVQQLYSFAPGPVGYWAFEEGQGTTANDSSTNGNTGTITNGTFATGKYGKGFSSDSDTDYVSVTASSSLNLTTSLTMEAWVYLTSAASTDIIMYKDEGYGMRVSTGTLQGAINTSGGWSWQSCTGLTVGTNGWHHVAIAYSADNTNFLCYYDGVLISTISRSGSKSDAGNGLFLSFNTADAFTGQLDEVKVYNYQRNTRQIVEDMNAGHPLGGSPVGSQMGYWKFDEGEGTVANDSSPQRNNGAITGMASPASVGISGWNPNGRVNKSLSFDGTNDTVTVTTSNALAITGELTLSAWVKMSTSGIDERPILSKWNSGTNQRAIALTLSSSDTVCLSLDSDGSTGGIDTACSASPLLVNKWYHVAAVYTPSQSIKIYLDGKLSTNLTNGIDSAIFNSTANFLIGGSVSGWSNLFAGDIDEVKVYNSALTQNDINIDYNRGQALTLGVLGTGSDGKTASNSAASAYCVPGDISSCSPPVAEWKYEQGQGASALDNSGNANTGTLTGSPSWGIGKIGKGVTLNSSTNDYVSVANNSSLNITGDLTVETWVNPSVVDTTQRLILEKGDGATAANRQYSLRMNATPVWQVTIYDGSNTRNAVSTVTPVVGRWDHLALVKRGTTLFIYVNGVQAGSVSAPNATNTSSSILAIGRPGATSSNYFKGTVDQTRIYNYARTQAQIAYDYNQGAPLSHWKMDECQGTTINDSVGTGSGTLSLGASGQTTVGTCQENADSAWYDGRVGKYNSSLDFDGSNDIVRLGNNRYGPRAQGASAVTISAWTNIQSYPGSNLRERVFSAWTGSDITGFYLGLHDDDGNIEVAGRSITSDSFQTAVFPYPGLNTWVHLVGVLDYENDLIKIYVNGVLRKTQSVTFASSTYAQGNPSSAFEDAIGAGYANNAVGEAIDGLVDDVKVWTYGLNDYQVKILFNQGSAVRFGPETGSP